MAYLIIWSVVAATIIGAIIGRAYERNRWQERMLERAGLPNDGPKRLDEAALDRRPTSGQSPRELADALDTIAVEVERIGEGQRFLTKLLAERENRSPGMRPPSPVPGSTRSPVPPAS